MHSPDVLTLPLMVQSGEGATGPDADASRIAWAFNESGRRNVWVAEGPGWKARQLTNYPVDDGQELTSISISSSPMSGTRS